MKREMNKRKSHTGVRIIGGSLRRSKIEVLDRDGLRPTPDRVRETLFNWLIPALPGAIVIDCFAGSGALGLEALSRGASECTFLEKDRAIARQLQKNLERFQLSPQATVICSDVFQASRELFREADIIFADPPFHHGISQDFLTWIHDKVQPDSRLVIECEHDQDLNLRGFETIRELRAGIDWLRLLRPKL